MRFCSLLRKCGLNFPVILEGRDFWTITDTAYTLGHAPGHLQSCPTDTFRGPPLPFSLFLRPAHQKWVHVLFFPNSILVFSLGFLFLITVISFFSPICSDLFFVCLFLFLLPPEFLDQEHVVLI